MHIADQYGMAALNESLYTMLLVRTCMLCCVVKRDHRAMVLASLGVVMFEECEVAMPHLALSWSATEPHTHKIFRSHTRGAIRYINTQQPRRRKLIFVAEGEYIRVSVGVGIFGQITVEMEFLLAQRT